MEPFFGNKVMWRCDTISHMSLCHIVTYPLSLLDRPLERQGLEIIWYGNVSGTAAVLIVTVVTLLVFYRMPDNFGIRSAFTCASIRIGAYKYSNMNEIERACCGIVSQQLATRPKRMRAWG